METISALGLTMRAAESRAAETATPRGRADFRTALDRARSERTTAPSLHEDLVKLRDRMLSGHRFSTQELLLYQIRAGEFNLRVELLSRAAESALSVTRRFQNQ